MTMPVRHLAEQAALALTSAVLFVSFFGFNNWIFSSFQYSEGINWIFLPAGFRVILVLTMGLPGAMGLMLGSWYIDSASLTATGWFFPFFNGVVSGMTPWLVMKYLMRRGWLAPQLGQMTAARLLQVTLIFSAASAMSDQLVWWSLEKPDANIWVDVWPMFVGNALGALLMLYGMKFVIDRMRLSQSRDH
jgi:phosphoglycerol transferase MdoB-like AlkP superfamily enzyme